MYVVKYDNTYCNIAFLYVVDCELPRELMSEVPNNYTWFFAVGVALSGHMSWEPQEFYEDDDHTQALIQSQVNFDGHEHTQLKMIPNGWFYWMIWHNSWTR